MSDLKDVVNQYIDVWNETDETARRKKIDALWAEGATYIDPLASVEGRDGFDAVVGGAQAQFQGLTFVAGQVFDAHHNIVRFTWDLVPAPGAEPIVIGFDVATVNDAGQITAVTGFIDKMPAAA